jgi:uncharacterized protein
MLFTTTRRALLAATVLAGMTGAAVAPTLAQDTDIELPDTIGWTAYDVGSGGYNQAVAIGSALKNVVGVDLRVLPGRNDVARQIPLREGNVHFSATGIGASYFAQEGVFEFGAAEWGPQEVRVLIASNGDGNLGIGVAADTDATQVEDLRGLRVAWVVGAPALNQNITAMLGFADMTWDDVERVDFPGFGASWEGMINNQVDAAFAATTSGQAYQLEASPRGLTWVVFPHDDDEGWQRLQQRAPFFARHMATEGAGLSEDNPHEGAAYPYPVLISYVDQETDLVYNMTKAMVELYPEYEGAAPGASGWASRQADLRMGGALPRGRHPLLRGDRRLERGGAGAQRHARRAPAGDEAGLGGVHRRGRRGRRVREPLADAARRAAGGSGHGSRVHAGLLNAGHIAGGIPECRPHP